MDKVIKAIECKHVTHLPKDEHREDTMVAKLQIHYEDGTSERKLEIVTNYERPFWVTKEHHRNHKQKKESEEISKLNKYMSTESDLGKNVGIRLGGIYNARSTFRDVCNSPYVYGLNISNRVLFRHEYNSKCRDIVPVYTVCALDIETDIYTQEITVISVAMKDKIYTAINKKLIENYYNPIEQIEHLYKKYIPESPISSNIVRSYEIFDSEIELIKKLFKVVHSWQPDYLTVWNIPYDIPHIAKRCRLYGVDPKDVFSDPSLPENLRYYHYKEGPRSRMTASGVYKSYDPHEIWDIITVPASFAMVDAMSVYYYNRVGSKKIPTGYSLDSILNVELGEKYKKLHFDDDDIAKSLTKTDWHIYMSKSQPLRYIVYNQWDVISMCILDDAIVDIESTMPVALEDSPVDVLNSGPKKIVNSIFFFYLAKDRVLGTAGIGKSEDTGSLGLDGWISFLANDKVRTNRLALIEECGDIVTNIRAETLDADQVSGYPSDGQAANVSKETTSKVVLKIGDIEKSVFKLQNMNIMYGKVNAIEYCTVMHNFPTLQTLSDMIE